MLTDTTLGPDARTATRTRWLCVSASGDGSTRFVFVASQRYPDGMRVELPAPIAAAQVGGDAVAEAVIDADGATTQLRVVPQFAPKAPPVWFAEVRESARTPPATNLVVFSGHGQPANTLVAASDLAYLGVSSADQLAALRWYPASGEVHQVYVQPQWRRHSIGTLLVLAGSVLSQSRDWPRLWGNGHRTDLGEVWREQSSWRHRAAERTHGAPPMTPETTSS